MPHVGRNLNGCSNPSRDVLSSGLIRTSFHVCKFRQVLGVHRLCANRESSGSGVQLYVFKGPRQIAWHFSGDKAGMDFRLGPAEIDVSAPRRRSPVVVRAVAAHDMNRVRTAMALSSASFVASSLPMSGRCSTASTATITPGAKREMRLCTWCDGFHGAASATAKPSGGRRTSGTSCRHQPRSIAAKAATTHRPTACTARSGADATPATRPTPRGGPPSTPTSTSCSTATTFREFGGGGEGPGTRARLNLDNNLIGK